MVLPIGQINQTNSKINKKPLKNRVFLFKKRQIFLTNRISKFRKL